MPNLALIIGTGSFGEDVLFKYPWLKYLNKNHSIFIASRIEPIIHHNPHLEKIIGHTEYVALKKSFNELVKISTMDYIYESSFIKKNTFQ